jgi:hypothetical protein
MTLYSVHFEAPNSMKVKYTYEKFNHSTFALQSCIYSPLCKDSENRKNSPYAAHTPAFQPGPSRKLMLFSMGLTKSYSVKGLSEGTICTQRSNQTLVKHPVAIQKLATLGSHFF